MRLARARSSQNSVLLHHGCVHLPRTWLRIRLTPAVLRLLALRQLHEDAAAVPDPEPHHALNCT